MPPTHDDDLADQLSALPADQLLGVLNTALARQRSGTGDKKREGELQSLIRFGTPAEQRAARTELGVRHQASAQAAAEAKATNPPPTNGGPL